MKRDKVKQEHKWNLDDIFPSVSEWEKALDGVKSAGETAEKFKGKLGQKEIALECLKFLDETSKIIEKLFSYAYLLSDQDLTVTSSAELKNRIQTVYVAFDTATAFVTPELSELDEDTLNSYINDKEFSDYDYSLSKVVKLKKHILTTGEERLLALSGKTLSAFSEIFSLLNNIELPLPKIDINGKKVRMTHGLYGMMLQSTNRNTRKKAFKGMYGAIKKLVNTIGATFSASINKDNFVATAKNYPSALDKSLSLNDVPTAVYSKLVTEVNKNLPVLHDYMALRKKLLGGELNMYDLHTPLFEGFDMKCDFEEAYQLVINGLEPMGGEYAELLKKARDERWIDVCETENKRSGAYVMGIYGVHPYILLNYHQTMNEIFTIAHEMGHAVHSYYSAKNQPYAKNDYAIFVAEVASTVNEVLLIKHLLKLQRDQKSKDYLLAYYLGIIRTTLFRQTMFAEFEKEVHEKEAEGIPLTVEFLNDYYYGLNKKYYGDAVTHDKEIKYEWARIPHFYSAFYVYQYSTGLISAINIANAILEGKPDAFENYKKFLSAGGHKSPFEILKDAGVDLLSEQPYNLAFTEFRNALEELKVRSEK